MGRGPFASSLVVADLGSGAVVLAPQGPSDLAEAVGGRLEPSAEEGDDVGDGGQQAPPVVRVGVGSRVPVEGSGVVVSRVCSWCLPRGDDANERQTQADLIEPRPHFSRLSWSTSAVLGLVVITGCGHPPIERMLGDRAGTLRARRHAVDLRRFRRRFGYRSGPRGWASPSS